MARLALVQCVNQKADETLPARDLYQSGYFGLMKDWADTFCDEWWILSAKHAVVDQETELAPYDKRAKDIDDVASWLDAIEARLPDEPALNTFQNELWVFLGQSKLTLADADGRTLEDILRALPVEKRYPFEQTAGMGYQQSWLKDCLEADTVRMPDDFEENVYA